MIKVRQLFKMLFLLMAIISLSACTKEDSGEGGGGGDSEYLWGETGSEATSLKKDVPMSDLETFIEYVAKVENLKLQTIKLFSNNWEGELFCGDMTNADPDKMNALITEILENRVRYEKAASQLEQAGVLSQVTTRGPVTATLDFINGLSEVTSDDENLIKDALEKTKMMGDKQAQQQLFDVLPNNLRAGCTDASTWFKKFNNRELTTKAHEIKKCWYFQTSGVNDATMQFRDNLDAVTGTKNGNAVWNTAAKTTMTLADKGMNVQLATLDQLSGGSISKMQDVEIVMEETAKIRKKYKEGTLTSNDFAKLQTVVGKNLLDKVLEKYLLPEEYKTISEEMLKQVQSEMTDYVYEKELEAAEEDAAKGTNKSIMQTINNIAGAQMYGSLSVGSDGKVNVGLPNKDGNVTMVTSANTDQTVTSVTDKGDRATQKVKPKPGKETISADPAPSDLSYEINPTSLKLDAEGDKKAIDTYSDIKYFGVKSNSDWIRVSKTGRSVIVEADENDTGKERKGSITIAFSQDKQTVLATVSVPISQAAMGDEDDSGIIADLPNFTKVKIYLGFTPSNVSSLPDGFYYFSDQIPADYNKGERVVIWASGTTTKDKTSMTFKSNGSADHYYSLGGYTGKQNWDIGITIDSNCNISGYVKWLGDGSSPSGDKVYLIKEAISFNLDNVRFSHIGDDQRGHTFFTTQKWSSVFNDFQQTYTFEYPVEEGVTHTYIGTYNIKGASDDDSYSFDIKFM